MSAIGRLDSVVAAAPQLATPVDPLPQPANDNVGADAKVTAKTWLAVVGAALGAFLAVLNIQIVNSSLADPGRHRRRHR
jgi:DHA2 family multidrug resistance protein